jgi:beta-lactamase regulating signal transducer with metallopeptidase domain
MPLADIRAWFESVAAAEQFHRLGWVVVHSVWQSAVVAAMLAVALRFLPRRSPLGQEARYVLATFALFSLPVICGVTWAVVEPPRAATVVPAAVAGRDAAAGAAPTVPPAPSATTIAAPAADAPARVATAAPSAPPIAAAAPPSSAARLEAIVRRARAAAEPWLPACAAVWLAGAVAAAGRLAVGWSLARRLVAEAAPLADARWQARLERWKSVLGITTPIGLVASGRVDVPIVVGWLRPVVIWPLATVAGMPADQLDAILTHELAHVRRHDVLVNLLQSVVEAAFFHHPACWWISAQVRAEREHCADDLAVRALSAGRAGARRSYATALLALEERRQVALGTAANGGRLGDRVRRLVGIEPPCGHPARLAAAVVVLVACLPMFASLAQEDRARSFLDRPENRLLKEHWPDARPERPGSSPAALAAWVRGTDSPPTQIDSLLELVEIDPTGPTGDIAIETLNWLFAPRLMLYFDSVGCAGAYADPVSVLERLSWLDDSLEINADLKPRLEKAMMPAREFSHSHLDELRATCRIGQVPYRMDDQTGKAFVEPVADVLTRWRKSWKEMRDDSELLMDLGLLAKPAGATLAAVDVAAWAKKLGDADPRRARVARAVLRDVPDALVGEVEKAGGAAGRGFAALLSMRHQATLYPPTGDNRPGFSIDDTFSCNLDGSGRKTLAKGVGKLQRIWATKGAIFASVDGGIWRLGDKPEKISDLDGYAWPSPDGASLAVRDDANTLWLLDTATRKAEKLDVQVQQARWSADGKLAWSTNDDIIIRAGGKNLVVAGCRPEYEFWWNPAGTQIAFRSRRHADDAELKDWKLTMDIVDATTGERTVISGPHTWLDEPTWSPDGTQLAYTWRDHGPGQRPAMIEIWDVAGKRASIVPHPKPAEDARTSYRWVEWLSGGRLLFIDSGMQGLAILDPATGRWAMKNQQIDWPYKMVGDRAIVWDYKSNAIVLVDPTADDRVPILESPTEPLWVPDFVERK